jgi:hypothetical protein
MKGPLLVAAVLVVSFTLSGEPAFAHSARLLRQAPAGAVVSARLAACGRALPAMRLRQAVRHGQITRREAALFLRRHPRITREVGCDCRQIPRPRRARERWF